MSVSKENVKGIFEEVLTNVDKNKETEVAASLTHCHFKNLFSVWLTDTIRCFYAEDDIVGISPFDSSKPNENNENFLLHDHRNDLTSIPLSGIQENIKYEINENFEENCSIYKEYKFFSGILNSESKPKYEYVGDVILKTTDISKNEPWFMKKEEIHRVYWKGEIYALIKEHRKPNEIRKEPTKGFLISSAEKFPCEDNLYQPISIEKYDEIVGNIISLIKSHICLV